MRISEKEFKDRGEIICMHSICARAARVRVLSNPSACSLHPSFGSSRPTPKKRSLAALPEPADLPEVGEHFPAGHVFQHHVEVRVVLWGRKKDDSTNKMDKTATDCIRIRILNDGGTK